MKWLDKLGNKSIFGSEFSSIPSKEEGEKNENWILTPYQHYKDYDGLNYVIWLKEFRKGSSVYILALEALECSWDKLIKDKNINEYRSYSQCKVNDKMDANEYLQIIFEKISQQVYQAIEKTKKSNEYQDFESKRKKLKKEEIESDLVVLKICNEDFFEKINLHFVITDGKISSSLFSIGSKEEKKKQKYFDPCEKCDNGFILTTKTLSDQSDVEKYTTLKCNFCHGDQIRLKNDETV